MRRQLVCAIALCAFLPAARWARAAESAPAKMVFCEAEEFKVSKGRWQRQKYGENYYVGTFANTFLSRKAFLGAPEQCERCVATQVVDIPSAGRYLALVRYEAAFRFETRFRLLIEQKKTSKLDRVYGARESIKIWPFGKRLTNEVGWYWGASENIVWEGHDAWAELQAGPALITLVAEGQPEPAARRNIDCLMLTAEASEVRNRIEKEGYLPLDGLLTQAGDLYLKVSNAKDSSPLTLNIPSGTEHSPYWVHQRNWKPKLISAAAGESSDWVEVGSQLDALNDGQWQLSVKKSEPVRYTLEFGVKSAAEKIKSIRRFENLTNDISLAYDADTRYSQRIRSTDELLYELVAYLKKHPVRAQAPRQTLIYGATFPAKPRDAKYTAALEEFVRLMGGTAFWTGSRDETLGDGLVRGYIDVRDQTPQQLEKFCRKLTDEGRADRIATVSLGDEISLAAPRKDDHAGFRGWLQKQGLKPADVDTSAGDDWEQVIFSPGGETAKTKPGLFYLSTRYKHYYGIHAQNTLTEVLRRWLPNALIGANYSPHHERFYLGDTHKWVSLFRDGGMTMPWSEDYIFQVPMGSQQMNFISLDLFRAGMKGNPKAKIHFYVMPHWPGNTPASWRRQFYGDIGHGAKIINLFEFRPVQTAYTENHCSSPEMFQAVRLAVHELGLFEDIVQDGQVRPGVAGLWFSEAADIWNDNQSPFDAAKRTLYIAIRHQQLPLDVVVEGDDLTPYKVMYLADRHISRAASKAIMQWVRAGGRLFATAGAGMFDELNQPNTMMRELLGVEQEKLIESRQAIHLEKQDLPFADPLETVQWQNSQMPIYGAYTTIKTTDATIEGRFADGSPAVTSKRVGAGRVLYCSFMPGLSYFKPALPKRPVDRSSRDDSFCHFVPSNFDRKAYELIGSIANVTRPIVASDPLVETTVIEAKQGTVITLNNWSGKPVHKLEIQLEAPPSFKKAILASGGSLRESDKNGKAVFTLDLAVADALILR